MAIRKCVAAAALVCLLLIGHGCGPGAATPRTTPVQGQVLYRGKGVGGVRVVFNPLFEMGSMKFAPGAVTDKDGRFQLNSATTADGAPEGTYAVTFTWPDPTKNPEEGEVALDRWRNKYADPARSKWKVTIREGTSELEPFRLD